MQHFGLGAVTVLVCTALVSFSHAAEPPKPTPGVQQAPAGRQASLRISIGDARLIRLPEPAVTIVIANPDIVSVQLRSSTSYLLLGLKAGRTTMFVLGEDDKVLQTSEIVVLHDTRSMSEALRQAVPNGKFNVVAMENGLLLTGTVESADDALTAGRVLGQFAGDPAKVINRVQMVGPNQVQLRVRIAEVKRSALRAIGLNWDAIVHTSKSSQIGIVTGNSARLNYIPPAPNKDVFESVVASVSGRTLSFTSVLDLLEQQGLATVLAQPSLSAVSGQSATFLAGGEIPVPVPLTSNSGSQVALQYKAYGVSLSFTPTILAGRRISMRVNPEVSSLDAATSVTYNGYNVPGIATRRADTSIELGSGESFIIAGLLSSTNSRDTSKLPGIGDLPVLGQLFRSERFQRDETELLIVVTPFLASASDAAVPLPTDSLGGTQPPPAQGPRGPGFGTK